MMRVNAYEYLLMEHSRRKADKAKKKKSAGFEEILKEEAEKLERRTEMEKVVNVALTIPELLMIQKLSDTQNMEFEYSWQRSVAESLEEKAKAACPKPVMSQWDFERAVKAEYDKWPEKDTAEQMAHAEAVRLKFTADVQKSA